MLRDYDEDNPQTYMADFDGDEIEFKILPLGLRDELINELGKDGSYNELVGRIGRVVESINGESVDTKMKKLTHLSDAGKLRNFIIMNSFLPEAVSKNSQPSPESSDQERARDAMMNVEPDEGSVSTTQTV